MKIVVSLWWAFIVDLVVWSKNQEAISGTTGKYCILAVNPEKMEMGLDAISFMGHHITREDIAVNLKIVRVIQNTGAPETVGVLHRFLSLINYVGKFIPNLIPVIKPLHKLTWSECLAIMIHTKISHLGMMHLSMG